MAYVLLFKNGLKVKQLAKQHPTLKTVEQKVLIGFWIKKCYWS